MKGEEGGKGGREGGREGEREGGREAVYYGRRGGEGSIVTEGSGLSAVSDLN